MIKTRSLLTKLSKKFPKRIAKKNHDYVGLMTGKLKDEIQRVVLCLDLDETNVEEALSFNPDIIISHHPFIFGTRASVFKRDERKKALAMHIDALNVAVYSMHTNFDEGKDGMNDALASALGLKDVKQLQKNPMGRGGSLEKPMQIDEFAKFAIKALHADYGLLVNKGSSEISSVAIIGGGGSRSWRAARDEGYDIFISGDAPHHVRRDVTVEKFNYLDLPHEIESIFIPQMKKLLLEIDPSLEILEIIHEAQPKVIK